MGFLLRVTGKPLDTFKQRGLWSGLIFKSLLVFGQKGLKGKNGDREARYSQERYWWLGPES